MHNSGKLALASGSGAPPPLSPVLGDKGIDDEGSEADDGILIYARTSVEPSQRAELSS